MGVVEDVAYYRSSWSVAGDVVCDLFGGCVGGDSVSCTVGVALSWCTGVDVVGCRAC